MIVSRRHFAWIFRGILLVLAPWPILRRLWEYVPTPTADPVYLYTNDLVGILPERRMSNGQPSLHAHLIHRVSPVDFTTLCISEPAPATTRRFWLTLPPQAGLPG